MALDREWEVARDVIARADERIDGLRKYGFSFVTALLTADALALHGLKDGDGAGIPWIAFLDANATALATSDGPKGNIGCPLEPWEIDWFMGMLRKVRNRITPDQLAQLESSLRTFAGLKPESRP